MKINQLLKTIIHSTVLKTINFIFRQLSDTPFLVYKVHMRAVEEAQTVFSLLGERITKGTVIVFDEYLGYRGWRIGEWKAWQEFVKEHSKEYEYLAFSDKQVAIRIL